ncbi:hypothetical protein NDU88_004279 [Pleurodeles waltl]|uniref:Uncharacterized protein n=1 Tax=Pleurodeles waltl TaxID=8319 RepID=A0AAV7PDJ1_PLEWA|nr:hypothetical protein NDU88_004279 [Pleurodeles waltl]
MLGPRSPNRSGGPRVNTAHLFVAGATVHCPFTVLRHRRKTRSQLPPAQDLRRGPGDQRRGQQRSFLLVLVSQQSCGAHGGCHPFFSAPRQLPESSRLRRDTERRPLDPDFHSMQLGGGGVISPSATFWSEFGAIWVVVNPRVGR